VIAAFTGYAVYGWARRLLRDTPASRVIGAALGAWLGVMAAAAATALQLAASGTVALEIVLPAMLGVHALIGVGEALITVGALSFIRLARPDLIGAERGQPAAGSGWVAAGLLIALAVALLSPLADPNPDGLERVAEDQGFIAAAQDAPYNLIPDYVVPGVENEALATMAAGVIGVAVLAVLGWGLARAMRRRAPESASS
jgi:cobalt/nickel transport system permease protein